MQNLFPLPGPRHVQVASMECVRGSLAAVGLDNKLYAMGGGEPNVNQDTVEIYDAHHNAWMPGPTMNNRRFTTAAALHNNSIFVSGGYDGTQYLKSVERLDPREGKWQLVRHLPVFVAAAPSLSALLCSLAVCVSEVLATDQTPMPALICKSATLTKYIVVNHLENSYRHNTDEVLVICLLE